MHHKTGRDVGRVNGASGRAATRLCVTREKQCRGIMSATHVIGGCQDSDRLAKHPAVSPKLSAMTGRSPNRAAGFDRIHTAEYGLAQHELRPIPVVDRLYFD